MTRQEYIAGLEYILKQVKELGAAFAAVKPGNVTIMEKDRNRKTSKLIADLHVRIYEDIAISAKVAADMVAAGIGEQGDLFEDSGKAKRPDEGRKNN